MKSSLMDKEDVLPYLTDLFCASGEARKLLFQVREDVCFKNNRWLTVGEITIHPSAITDTKEKTVEDQQAERRQHYLRAIKKGHFEWLCPKMETLRKDCGELLEIHAEGDKNKAAQAEDTMRRALEAIIDVATRAALQHPIFDPESLSVMPFRRPKTIVCDTNSILKGALDFCARFLFPMARIKVPAIVHMEIINQTDRYLKQRRQMQRITGDTKPVKRAQALLDHVTSQSGQRALLRLELHTDVEIERNSLFADPLREAFKPEKGGDMQDLNLCQPVRSYCDRLILETARSHQSMVSSGHEVFLLTCDEGLGRMILAEGFKPLFFHASRPEDMFGQCWTGTAFSPFGKHLTSVALPDLLWEMAVTFGQARLATPQQKEKVEVTAMDENLQWLPFHAKNDLLMVSASLDDIKQPATIRPPTDQKKSRMQTGKNRMVTKKSKGDTSLANTSKTPLAPIYEINADILLTIMAKAVDQGRINKGFRGTVLAKQSDRTRRNYIGFLKAGGFITEGKDDFFPGKAAAALVDGIRSGDRATVAEILNGVPSFSEFVRGLPACPPDGKGGESGRRLRAYWILADAAGQVLRIPEKGHFRTDAKPTIEEFCKIAIETYEGLMKGDPLVLTGAWLESLAMKYGVHPLLARELTAESMVAEKLSVTTEGSTPETQYPNHISHMFLFQNGSIKIESFNLFFGDFLIEGKASVSIQLKRGKS